MTPDKIFLHVDGRRVSLEQLATQLRESARTVDARGCTGLTALPDLPSARTVDARGCTGLTALPDLPNAEYVYASGCTGLTALIFGGKNPRGYEVIGAKFGTEWRIMAGCRFFTIEQARHHWGESDRAHAGCLAVAEKLISEIDRRERLTMMQASEVVA